MKANRSDWGQAVDYQWRQAALWVGDKKELFISVANLYKKREKV